jgi:H/ACA ribonucleoprotein complex non-core subunit NAF1
VSTLREIPWIAGSPIWPGVIFFLSFLVRPDSSPENSDSDTSDSDDSSVVEEFNPAKMREFLDSIDDEDDEGGGGGGAGGRPITAHEVLNENVVIPDVMEVDPKETLERVGEILSVLQDKVVIVKGLAHQITGHAANRALDIETLLVFEDRKVLGYVSPCSHLFPAVSFLISDAFIPLQIHETFGPTHQPMYQVLFDDKFPLDKERAQISRPIFHVPGRSNFVFIDKLRLARGSDASNAHDEEPGEDEVEFSDDEQEAAYKRMLKERFFCSFTLLALVLTEVLCVRRSGSRASSRAATPGASARRDYDYSGDTFGGSSNPYDEHGAYDMNYGAGPSRPPPIPYDDPYSDSFTSAPTDADGEGSMTFNSIRNGTGRHDSMRPGSMGLVGSFDNTGSNSRNLGPGSRYPAPRGRGRGGSRNRQSDRGRRGRGKGTPQHPQQRQPFPQRSGSQDYSSGLTPPSGFVHPYSEQSGYGGGAAEWNYGAPLMTPQQPVFGFGVPNSFSGVQPHINPRFANQLGFNQFNVGQMSQIPQTPPGAGSPPPSEQYHPGDADLRPTTGHPQ